jgi:hypothetical protein
MTTVRTSAVLVHEDGDRRAVQSHASLAVPNAQMVDALFSRAASA